MTDPRFAPKTPLGRLFKLVEEAGEVAHAAGKVGRHGYLSVNPLLPKDQQETNAAWLRREMRDLKDAIADVEADIIDHIGHDL